eukprot:g7521.t1
MSPTLSHKPFRFVKSRLRSIHHFPIQSTSRWNSSPNRNLIAPKKHQQFLRSVQSVECSSQDKETPVSEVLEETPVELRVQANLRFGESFKVCGNCEALGNWKLESAPELNWNEGDIWKLNLDLPIGKTEAKLVVVSSDPIYVNWEPGENRILKVPRVGDKEMLCVNFIYLQTQNTDLSIIERKDEIKAKNKAKNKDKNKDKSNDKIKEKVKEKIKQESEDESKGESVNESKDESKDEASMDESKDEAESIQDGNDLQSKPASNVEVPPELKDKPRSKMITSRPRKKNRRTRR